MHKCWKRKRIQTFEIPEPEISLSAISHLSNTDKNVCLCYCWHLCILKQYMKVDENIIPEGYVINDREK